MNFRQYRRLVLVSFLPLLGAGWLMAHLAYPYPRSVSLMCDMGCRNLDYSEAKDSAPAWFDVTFSGKERDKTSLYYMVSAAQRTVNATAVSTDRAPGVPSAPAVVTLGIDNEKKSYAENGKVYFYCNSYEFVDRNTFSSRCYGDDWSEIVKFHVEGASADQLNEMVSDINSRIEFFERDYLLYRIATYPLFIYAFLLLSLIAWVTRRAYRYVIAAGDETEMRAIKQ